jgi:hypothetical protein
VIEVQPTPEQPRRKPPRRLGLSGKLLLLTIPLVMIAEILIYVPWCWMPPPQGWFPIRWRGKF